MSGIDQKLPNMRPDRPCRCRMASATCSAGVMSGKQPRHLEGAHQPAPDALHRAHAGHVLAGERDLAGIRPQMAGDEIDEGGLAGAVRADQRDAVARRHAPARRRLRDRKAAEGLHQPLDLEDRAHGALSCRARCRSTAVPIEAARGKQHDGDQQRARPSSASGRDWRRRRSPRRA